MANTLQLIPVRIALVCTVVPIWFSPAHAETMTLETSLALAYETNPQLESERAKVRATDEGVAKAISATRPSIGAQGSYGWEQYSEPGFFGTVNSQTHPQSEQVTLSQNIFDGHTVAAIEQAKSLVDADRAELAATEQSVMLSAATAYFDVVRDEAVVVLYTQDIVELRTFLRNSQDRLQLGELTKTDTSQAEARLTGAQLNMEAAEQQLAQSRADFQRFIGRVPESLQPHAPPQIPRTEDAVLDVAVRDNPVMIESRAQARAADHNVTVAMGALLPTLTLQAQYGRSINSISPGISESGTTVTGQLTFPIYQGGSEDASIRQAKEQRAQAELTIAEAEREVRENTQNAWSAYLAGHRSVALSELQTGSNEAAFEGTRQESRVGSRTVLDVLNANQELLQSKIAHVTAQAADAVARYQVISAMGHLTATALRLPVKLYDPKVHFDDVEYRWIGLGH